MFNLDQFYTFFKEYVFDTYRDLDPAVVYPYPFGSTTSDKVVIHSSSEWPKLVFLFYDQEPIWDNVEFLEYYGDEFSKLGSTVILITTQQWGPNLDHYVKKYNWHTVYYFHHAIATQDWFRGYYNHPLASNPSTLEYHYYSLNRLFDGYRAHRRWFLSELYQYNMLNKGLISFPNKDPITGKLLSEAFTKEDKKICPFNKEIDSILPLTLDDHSNRSFEIEFLHSKRCFVNVVTETVFDFHENYISEKAFKPFIQQMPMIVLSPPNTLSTLQQYGFETWHEYWDEGYDSEQNNIKRFKMAFEQLSNLCHRPLSEIQSMYSSMEPILTHNKNYFYSNEYRNIITKELYKNLDNAITELTAQDN